MLDKVGLRITVGVAVTKFLAKVASAVAKPDGLLVVPPGTELDFLHPLPVQRLWGVGPKNTAKLHEIGIYTVGQVAGMGEAGLISILGQASGRHLHALAHNRDPRRVRVGHRRRSIGSQHAMGRARHRPADIDAVVVGLVDRVTRRMRNAERTGRTVVLRLRFDDFTRVSRSHTLLRATAHTDTILATVRGLVTAAMPMIEKHGPHPGRDRGRQSRRRDPCSSSCRSMSATAGALGRRTGRGPRPVRLGRRHPGRAAGPRQGMSMPVLPD